MKIRQAIAVCLLAAPAAFAGKWTTFGWDWDASWPVGTTIELCGNGNTCASGLTGTQYTLDLPVVQGQVISGRARAIPPAGYLCGDPPVLCGPSGWGMVQRTWPVAPANFIAARQEVTQMAATIVSGSVAKATQQNSKTITLSNYTINAGTDLALFVIWCGNYQVNGDEGTTTWNPGASTAMTVVIKDTNSSYGSCSAFVLKNPTTGTGTITFSAPGGTSDEDNLLYAFVVSGVDQTTPTADAAGDTAGTATSKTLTIPNMTVNDLAIAAISIDNSSASISITAGNNIGADSTDFVSAWTDAGAAYSTGTGNVNITFGKSTANGGALRFRIVGIGDVTAASTPLLPAFNTITHLIGR